MKKINYLKPICIVLLGVLIAFTFSCGSKQPKVAKVRPEKTEISGDLSDYLEVIDNEYEVVGDYGADISIKMKAIKSVPSNFFKTRSFDLKLSLLAENGMPISGIDELTAQYNSQDKLQSLLVKGSGEEIVQFKSYSGYKSKEHAEKVKKFTVSSIVKEDEGQSATYESSSNDDSDKSELSESEDSNDEELNSSSTDCDKFVKNYEEFADSYIKFLNKYKANPNDPKLLKEYTETAQKALELQNQVALCTDMKYVNRITKVAVRLAEAAQSLQEALN